MQTSGQNISEDFNDITEEVNELRRGRKEAIDEVADSLVTVENTVTTTEPVMEDIKNTIIKTEEPSQTSPGKSKKKNKKRRKN